ncbi:MAG: protease modulator HflC [Alphaproteobacteria bacterium]|nr:protease modulator HflC [Alphaproteobacteria bacterium]MCB1551316.1 protease modulator HflC [Alphaproteobacteria bacterium]MCB9984181.1 protease modulator HflC [Micavibrio sp.]HPQ50297.1 protease modulator HflC [Alphaproteobacteria bacterium]
MSDGKILGLLIAAVVAFILINSSIFTVTEGKQVIILRFGDPKEQITDPGLHFKMPLIDNIRAFEKRILNVDPPSEEVLLADQKRLVVDSFARYRITDMLVFLKTLNTEASAQQRLHTVINSALRSTMGKATLQDILSEKRDSLMEGIQTIVNEEAKRFGIEVVDVRIVRADLPEQVTQATFDRMRSEREREAREARAEGEQLSTEIRSKADKERTILLAEAKRDSEIARGEGDRKAIDIYGQAFGEDPEFYAFYRSLEAYRNSLSNSETTLMISPENDFLKFFKDKMK